MDVCLIISFLTPLSCLISVSVHLSDAEENIMFQLKIPASVTTNMAADFGLVFIDRNSHIFTITTADKKSI